MNEAALGREDGALRGPGRRARAGGAVSRGALGAARALAVTHGLPATNAVVLHAGRNVAVPLAPAPVVVRVMTAPRPCTPTRPPGCSRRGRPEGR